MFVALPVLLLLSCSSSPTTRATGDRHNEYTVVAISSLKPKAACSGHRGACVLRYHPYLHGCIKVVYIFDFSHTGLCSRTYVQ
jgi:hypothetical protein